jgi:hypothetical protein
MLMASYLQSSFPSKSRKNNSGLDFASARCHKVLENTTSKEGLKENHTVFL